MGCFGDACEEESKKLLEINARDDKRVVQNHREMLH